jgi:hypothetical protein
VKYVRCALIYLFVCKSVRETKVRADIYICVRAHIRERERDRERERERERMCVGEKKACTI